MSGSQRYWNKVAKTPWGTRTRQVFAFNWGSLGVGFAMVGWRIEPDGRVCFGKVVSRTTGIIEPVYEYFGPGEPRDLQARMLAVVKARRAIVTDVVEIVDPQVEISLYGPSANWVYRMDAEVGKKRAQLRTDVAAIAAVLEHFTCREEAWPAQELAIEAGLSVTRVRSIMSEHRGKIPFIVGSAAGAGYWNAGARHEVEPLDVAPISVFGRGIKTFVADLRKAICLP